MIAEFCEFYRYLKHLPYLEFCRILNRDRTDRWAIEKWMSMHSDTGAWICLNSNTADILYSNWRIYRG